MAYIINEYKEIEDESSAVGIVVGIIVAIVLTILFFLYILPMVGGSVQEGITDGTM